MAGLENVGKVCETKTVVIPGQPPYAPADFKSWLDQTRAERHMTDADGWYCREKRYNVHYQSKKGYALPFYRFVPRKGADRKNHELVSSS